MSTTDRFINLSKQNPNVRILNSEKFKSGKDEFSVQNSMMTTNDPNSMNAQDKVQYDFKDTRTDWGKKEKSLEYGRHVGFDQTSPRFHFNQVFYGTSLKFDIPGPGTYAIGNRSDISFTTKPKARTKLRFFLTNSKQKGKTRPTTF